MQGRRQFRAWEKAMKKARQGRKARKRRGEGEGTAREKAR
jgi:hypothetical protein